MGVRVRGLLHRNPQFLYLHHSSDGTVKAQNSMQLPSADCATNCANCHVSQDTHFGRWPCLSGDHPGA